MGTSLLVASGGGHLEQMLRLHSRLIDASPVTWVTYDVPQAASSLEGERVVFAHHPTTKHVPNAVRNYRLARRLFAEHDVARVVSTGAAVAVPFMVRARQLGIPCHYLESATRVASPSLTGRILERVRGVRRYAQHRPYNARWRAGPSVFDGYRPDASAEAPEGASGQPQRALLSLGTHGFAFQELVARFRGRVSDGLDVMWQLGATPDPGGLSGRVVDQLPHDELEAEIRAADVVVGHAGVGLALTALSLGKVPVLVPRRRRRREHTDDHQVQLARELEHRGLAVVAEVGELTRGHLERAAGLVVTYDEPPPFELVD